MHFETHGTTGPNLILSSGLGGSCGYWAPQIAALSRHFRVVTYDHTGCAKTGGEVPENGGIRAMANDVLAIADALKLDTFHFIGHALGGLMGLDIALRQPGRISQMVLVNAWSVADPHSGRCFDVRIELLEKSGVPAFVKAQPLFLYPAIFMADNPARMAAEEAHAIEHFQGKTNILRRIAALRAFDVDAQLSEISTPTLVYATRDDLLVPYSRSERLAEGLPNAVLHMENFGGHAVNAVYPDAFNKTVIDFLDGDKRP